MSAGIVKRGVLAAFVLGLAVLGVGVSPVFAAQPWWKLQVDSSPAMLRPGQATDEVQEAKVSATEGTFELRSEEASGAGSHTFVWNATHQEVQEGLEEMFGTGNVEVPSGQGNATGSDPYKIIWKGAKADLDIEPLSPGGPVTVSEVTTGRSDATLILTAANLGNGDATGPVTISAKLPPGLAPLPTIVGAGGEKGFGRLQCSAVSLSCTYNGTTPPYQQVQMYVPVNLKPDAKSGETIEVSVSGGNAPPARRVRAMTVGSTPASFSIENYELAPEEEGGAPDTQAGSHPFQLTTTVAANQSAYNFNNYLGGSDGPEPAEMTKDLVFKLPPGLIGNPTPFPQCRLTQFTEGTVPACPNDTILGVAATTVMLRIGGSAKLLTTLLSPIFNLVPATGEPARFGFVAGEPVFLDTSVRTGGDYGVTVKVSNISQEVTFIGSRTTFWGLPGDSRHDGQRGESCIEDGDQKGGVPCSPT